MAENPFSSSFDINSVLLGNPLTAPLAAAGALLGAGKPAPKTPQQEALDRARQRQRGQKAQLGGVNVYWDDKAQTFRELKPYYERYGTPPGVSVAELGAAVPQATGETSSGDSGAGGLDTGESPTKPSLPETKGPTEGTEPAAKSAEEKLEELLKRYPELERFRTEQLMKASVLNAAIAQKGREQLTRRAIETETIKAWRDLETTRLQTQAQQMGALASVAYLSQQPNVGTMQALNEAFKGAYSPLPSLKGG